MKKEAKISVIVPAGAHKRVLQALQSYEEEKKPPKRIKLRKSKLTDAQIAAAERNAIGVADRGRALEKVAVTALRELEYLDDIDCGHPMGIHRDDQKLIAARRKRFSKLNAAFSKVLDVFDDGPFDLEV